MKSATWPIVTIESIQAAQKHATTGGPFGSKLGCRDYVETGVPVIRGTNLPLDSRFSLDDFVFVTEEKADSLIANNAHPGDVVFTQRGTLGQVGVIPKSCGYHRFVISQSQMKLTVDESQCDPEFIYYYFRSEETVNTIKGMSISAGVPHINLTMLREFPIPKPPLPLQRKIASILSAYDDLIENNTRRIAILEEMAQAIYREWFVNFRFPGHENVKLVDSPLGQIPEGWERKQLTEIADTRLGKMLDAKKNKGELMPYLANVNVRWGEFDLQNLREMKFEAKEHEKYGLKYGDIVMCEGGEPGRCAIWMEQVPNMMLQKAIHRIRSHDGVNFRFLYYTLRHKGQSGQLESLFTGATIKHLPGEKLKIVTLEVPSTHLMERFSQMVDPMISQVDVLTNRNSILRTTRDLLLPKLISGKLDVEDLDIDLELTAEALEEATAMS